jgi:GNAT superfamily N-acetyltransferase
MNNEQIKFVEAIVDDGEVLLTMMKEFYKIDSYPFDYQRNLTIFENLIAHPEWGRIWIVRLNDEVVAYFVVTFGYSFEYGGRDAIIDELYICEAWRNKGIGFEILNFIEAETKKLRIKTLHLEVEDTNKVGWHLYEKKGFKGRDRKFLSKSIASS